MKKYRSFGIDEDIYRKLEEMAKKENRSLAYIVNYILNLGLKNGTSEKHK